MSRQQLLLSLNRIDPELGGFIHVDAERALGESDAPAAGRLSGVPIAVKDSIDVAGMPTTCGSPLHRDSGPVAADAAFVSELRAQGAVVVGKTSLHELTYGVSGYNPHFPTPLHPGDRSRTAGGSSGGSAAAVAAGVCRIAIGSDTSGSTRIPAACCGVYGLKLARGAASLDGVAPLAPRYDNVGVFAAEVSDLQRALGIDALPEATTVAVGRLGVDLEAPALPAEAHWTLFREQVWGVFGERFDADPDGFGADVAHKLALPIGDVAGARDVLDAWRPRFQRAVAEYDVISGPALDGIAPTLAAARADYDDDGFLVGDRLLRHTPIYNELGWVALTVPTVGGPVQLAAPGGREPQLLSAAASIGLTASDTVIA